MEVKLYKQQFHLVCSKLDCRMHPDAELTIIEVCSHDSATASQQNLDKINAMHPKCKKCGSALTNNTDPGFHLGSQYPITSDVVMAIVPDECFKCRGTGLMKQGIFRIYTCPRCGGSGYEPEVKSNTSG